MYIIVDGTDMTKSMQYLTITAHVNFEPDYEEKNKARSEQRLKDIQQSLVSVMNEHFEQWQTEIITDEHYNNRMADK